MFAIKAGKFLIKSGMFCSTCCPEEPCPLSQLWATLQNIQMCGICYWSPPVIGSGIFSYSYKLISFDQPVTIRLLPEFTWDNGFGPGFDEYGDPITTCRFSGRGGRAVLRVWENPSGLESQKCGLDGGSYVDYEYQVLVIMDWSRYGGTHGIGAFVDYGGSARKPYSLFLGSSSGALTLPHTFANIYTVASCGADVGGGLQVAGYDGTMLLNP